MKSVTAVLSPPMAILIWILMVITVGMAAYGLIELIVTGHYPAFLKDS